MKRLLLACALGIPLALSSISLAQDPDQCVDRLSYRPAQPSNLNSHPYVNQRRAALFQAMGLLPQGLYKIHRRGAEPDLFDSLIISYSMDRRLISEPQKSLALVVEVWPGFVFESRSEPHHKEIMLAAFDSRTGVADGYDIEFKMDPEGNQRLTLDYSLVYGLGDDAIHFNFSKTGHLRFVEATGTSYDFVEMYPLQIQEARP